MNKRVEEDKNFLNIATSMVSGSLTFFIGSGFSKYLTDGKAPSWIDLLQKTIANIQAEDLFDSLFFVDKQTDTLKSHFDLTVVAQIIQEEYKRRGIDFKKEICKIIEEHVNEETINQDNIETVRNFLETEIPIVNVVTTNYDQLLNKYILPNKSRVYVEGSPIAKLLETRNLYHIHGSTLYPESLVVTQDDYFKFQHKETYITRKFYTLLQETTTVIIGYSLNDFNLNRILNEAKHSKHSNLRNKDIYYISYKPVQEFLKGYYFITFGITVIDDISLDKFFIRLNRKYHDAEKIVNRAGKIESIIKGHTNYKDEFLKLNNSFDIIISRIVLAGLDLNSNEVQEFLLDNLERKKSYTSYLNAWDQYTGLAYWLIEFGFLVVPQTEDIKNRYQALVKFSFSKMSNTKYTGFSWEAFQVWEQEWHRLDYEKHVEILGFLEEEEFNEFTGVPDFIKNKKKSLNH